MTDMMFAKGFAVVSIPHRNIIRDDIKTRKEAEQYMRALVECSAYKNNTVRVIDNT